MEKNTMKAGEVILVKVNEVKQDVKVGIKKGNMLYDRHDIYFEDKSGKTYVGEYLSPNVYKDDFLVGLRQHIKCTSVSQYGFEVQPTDPEEKEYLPNPNIPEKGEVKYEGKPRQMNFQGSSIAFAYSYAKDLVSEKMKHQLLLNLSEEELANKMADIADVICDRMNKKAGQ